MLERIETFIKASDVDLKKQDAIEVVKEIIRIKDDTERSTSTSQIRSRLLTSDYVTTVS